MHLIGLFYWMFNTTSGWIITILLWFILFLFCFYKQVMADKDAGDHTENAGEILFRIVIIFVFTPIWFIGAIIRQVIVEPWK